MRAIAVGAIHDVLRPTGEPDHGNQEDHRRQGKDRGTEKGLGEEGARQGIGERGGNHRFKAQIRHRHYCRTKTRSAERAGRGGPSARPIQGTAQLPSIDPDHGRKRPLEIAGRRVSRSSQAGKEVLDKFPSRLSFVLSNWFKFASLVLMALFGYAVFDQYIDQYKDQGKDYSNIQIESDNEGGLKQAGNIDEAVNPYDLSYRLGVPLKSSKLRR